MQQRVVNKPPQHTEWQAVNWQKAERVVRNLRERIFKAAQEGQHRKVRNLQKLMLRSYANALLSVRRVTQQNAGKKTPGVDKVVVKTPKARGKLVDELIQARQGKVGSPTRRVYIPKANGKQRPLGIPTMRDRALQAMVKQALEPEWEAQFEITSFGFRPGRGCHDAIENIWALASKGRKVWVLDADIKGAFDHISHDFLLRQLQAFPALKLVRSWLKAGFMEGGIFQDTPAGTPQGGVISPLLANIALHGMERALGVKRNRRGWVHESRRAVVRYADDFVVFCETQQDAELARKELSIWLRERGLQFSEEKTRVVHVDEGFDFLGFEVRRYAVQTKNTQKKRTLSPHHKLLIKPSKKAVQAFRDKLKTLFLMNKGIPPAGLIGHLNSFLMGWGNYYRHAVSKKTFHNLDDYVFRRLVRWIKFRHHNKGWKWLKARYFGQSAPNRRDQWVFTDPNTGIYVRKLSWIKIDRHVMVKGAASPDDPKLRKYWHIRKMKLLNLTGRFATVAYQQYFRCPICGGHLNNDEELQLHHLIQSRTDERRNLAQYQRLVHYFCHHQLHSGMHQQAAQKLFEPDASKGARPVLRGEGEQHPDLPN